MSELPQRVLDHFIHVGEADRFSVVATMMIEGFETIVGEARYAFDAEIASFEFGLSIDDRWQGQGIGSALLKNLECRAAAFGASRLFGDTLRSNDVMIGLARKSGFAFTNSPATGSWCVLRSISTLRRRKFPARAGGWPPPPAKPLPPWPQVDRLDPVLMRSEPGRFSLNVDACSSGRSGEPFRRYMTARL